MIRAFDSRLALTAMILLMLASDANAQFRDGDGCFSTDPDTMNDFWSNVTSGDWTNQCTWQWHMSALECPVFPADGVLPCVVIWAPWEAQPPWTPVGSDSIITGESCKGGVVVVFGTLICNAECSTLRVGSNGYQTGDGTWYYHYSGTVSGNLHATVVELEEGTISGRLSCDRLALDNRDPFLSHHQWHLWGGTFLLHDAVLSYSFGVGKVDAAAIHIPEGARMGNDQFPRNSSLLPFVINCRVDNSGRVGLGGPLEINGPYVQSAKGTLSAFFSDHPSGSPMLSVKGTATLDGGLEVRFDREDIVPPSFVVLRAFLGVHGRFASVAGSAFSMDTYTDQTLNLSVEYTDTDVIVHTKPDIEAEDIDWSTTDWISTKWGISGTLPAESNVGLFWSEGRVFDPNQAVLATPPWSSQTGSGVYERLINAADLVIPPEGMAYLVLVVDPPNATLPRGTIEEAMEDNNEKCISGIRIRGRVVDQSGQPFSYGLVSTSVSAPTMTDENGEYFLSDVDVNGQYYFELSRGQITYAIRKDSIFVRKPLEWKRNFTAFVEQVDQFHGSLGGVLKCGAVAIATLIPGVGNPIEIVELTNEALHTKFRAEAGDQLGWLAASVSFGVHLVHYTVSLGEFEPVGDALISFLTCLENLIWDAFYDICGGYSGCVSELLKLIGDAWAVMTRSPVDIRITDSAGGVLGIDETGAVFNTMDAPAWIFRFPGHGQMAIILDPSGEYSVSIAGNADAGTGATFDLQLAHSSSEGVAEIQTFTGVATSKTGIATVTMGSTTAPVLQVDADGNGVIEAALSPDPDSDGDGVPDQLDQCPATMSGVLVNASGCPARFLGDFDQDGDVDVADFEVFCTCATGPGVPYDASNLPPSCTLSPDVLGIIPADWDHDRDVDQSDFGIFQRCYSGAEKPADPNCAN